MPQLLLATSAPFHPAYQGDSARVAAIVAFFRQQHWRVDVVHCHSSFETQPDYPTMARLCDRLIVYYPSQDEVARRSHSDCDAWCPDGFAQLVGHVCQERAINVVIVQFAFLSKCLEQIDPGQKVLKIIDADNVFTDRRQRYAQLGLHYEWFSTTEDDERRALARADLILSIQEEERRTLAAMTEGIPIIVVPHAQAAPNCSQWRTHKILFVGSKNPANMEGLHRFLEGGLPHVRRHFPDAQLMIAGAIGETVAPDIPGVMRAGVVPTLDPLYRAASVVINPVVCGTGLSIKSVDALSRGKCLVTTHVGIAGVPQAETVAMIVAEPEDFGAAIVTLFNDPQRIRTLEIRARQCAEAYFHPMNVFRPLEQAILENLETSV